MRSARLAHKPRNARELLKIREGDWFVFWMQVGWEQKGFKYAERLLYLACFQ